MDQKRQVMAVGFPEMWQPVRAKYRRFFDCSTSLAAIINHIIKAPLEGRLLDTTGRMLAAAANSHGALLTLVLNGYGHDAIKIARSIYETELNVVWLKRHPEDLQDFIDYNVIQRKQLDDLMDEEQQKAVPRERHDRLMAEYNRVLPHFATGRDKTRPRNEWCRVPLYDRAMEAEAYWRELMEAAGQPVKAISLYKTFYRQASSLHHLDFGGVIASRDGDLNADMAPSWKHLDNALTMGTGSLLRTVVLFDEMACLGLKERLESGPNEDYVAALNEL